MHKSIVTMVDIRRKGLKKNSQVYKVSKCRDKTDRKYKVARVSYSMVNRVKEKIRLLFADRFGISLDGPI